MSGDCDKCGEQTLECKSEIELIEYHPRVRSYLEPYKWLRYMKNKLHSEYLDKLDKEIK